MAHGTKATPALELVAGTESNKSVPPAERRLSPKRQACAERASKIVGRAAHEASSYAREAKQIGVSKSVFVRWTDPEEAAAMTLRDVLAGGRGFQRAVALQLLADADAGAPVAPSVPLETRVLGIQGHLGNLASLAVQALADGKVTGPERRVLRRALGPLFEALRGLERELQEEP